MLTVEQLARLMGMREAAASVALDGETQTVEEPMTTPMSDERDLTNIDRLRIGALHVEPPFADEDLLDEIEELETEIGRLRSRVARLEGVLREVEWKGEKEYSMSRPPLPACPRCYGAEPHHYPDCELAAALRDAHE